MNMDFDGYLYSLLEDRETYDLEYKSAEGGFPGSFWDTYSSFANTQGGTIVLGVKEKHGNFTFDGLTEDKINKYIKTFWDCVNNKGHVSANIMKEDDVEIKEYGNNKIILFHIPRANRTQRPVYRTSNPYNGTFKRNDEGDYKCTEQEVKRMFADADDSKSKDSRILKGFTMDDIDMESIKQYRQLFASINSTHPWVVLDNLELLKKIGGYRTDRVTKEEGFTVAGLLMFGKYDSIVDNECVPNFFPDYRDIPEEVTTSTRWNDRIYPDGTWEANLFQFYRKVLPKLTSVLPKPFKLENNIRIEDTPTHIAVREAFINTLVHADYSAEGSLIITHKRDSFTFSNPGNMLISIAQYYEGGESVCRNRALQTMFMLIGSAEKAGSGVDKILAGWKEENWQRPYVAEKQRPDKVVLLLPMESLLPQANIDGLKKIYGDNVEHIGYNKLATLSICYAEKVVSNDRLKVLLPIHSSEITKMLKDLCNDGFLLSEGNGRGTTYTLKSLPKVDTSVGKVDTSTGKVDTSTGKVDTSAGKVDTSAGKVDTSTGKVDIPIKSRTHLKREELERLIICCSQDYTTLEDIAYKVNRDIKYLQNKVIPRMIQDHKIERLYPATPNHPNQKYKAKDKQ